MRFRHAAALTLVGWYLIQPHLLNDQRADMSVPLWHWYFYNERKGPDPKGEKLTRKYALVFRSERECQQKISTELAWKTELLRKVRWMDCPGCLELWKKAICIADDDPRLKK
jgi:hypothetical protein